MKKRYKILEHRADLKIIAFAKTKEDLFSNMLLGMSESQKVKVLPKTTKRKIEIESLDFEALLVDFLSEALYQSQVNREIYNKVRFEKFTETEIKGLLVGQKIESFGEDIKAVTYHDLNIKKREDGLWEATVLFDV